MVDVRLPLHFSHLKNLVSNVARWKEPMAIYFWIFLTQAINEGGIRKRSYVAALLGSGAWPVRIFVRQIGLKSQLLAENEPNKGEGPTNWYHAPRKLPRVPLRPTRSSRRKCQATGIRLVWDATLGEFLGDCVFHQASIRSLRTCDKTIQNLIWNMKKSMTNPHKPSLSCKL